MLGKDSKLRNDLETSKYIKFSNCKCVSSFLGDTRARRTERKVHPVYLAQHYREWRLEWKHGRLVSQQYFSHLETESNSQVLREGERQREQSVAIERRNTRTHIIRRGRQNVKKWSPGLYVSNYPCIMHIICARRGGDRASRDYS